jgi:hypothetical protein
MNFFERHADTAVILGTFFGFFMYIHAQFSGIDSRFGKIEQDLAVIKTVLIMKNILPAELAHKEG